MGLELIPYFQRKFKGEEIETRKKENEELSESEKEKIEELEILKKFWDYLQPFFTDIRTYEPKMKEKEKIDISEWLGEKQWISSVKDNVYKKEINREIDKAYIAEKIVIGFLNSLVKKNEIKEEIFKIIKQKNLRGVTIQDFKNLELEVCFPTEFADWALGDDGYLLIKSKDNEGEIYVPLHITTATKKNILEEKIEKAKKRNAILITLNILSIKNLIKRYLDFIEKEKGKENLKIKEKQEIKDKVKPPWYFFVPVDVKDEESNYLIKEGKSIIEQFIRGLITL